MLVTRHFLSGSSISSGSEREDTGYHCQKNQRTNNFIPVDANHTYDLVLVSYGISEGDKNKDPQDKEHSIRNRCSPLPGGKFFRAGGANHAQPPCCSWAVAAFERKRGAPRKGFYRLASIRSPAH